MKRCTFEGISPKKFRRKVGVKRRTFVAIVKQVQTYLAEAYARQPLHGHGKKSTTLSLTDNVLLTLLYLRQYPPFEELGDMFGISESYANKLYHRYLDILVRVLRVLGKKALLEQGVTAILIDVTEQPMERPMTKQRQWYSGKKKRHTIKAQLIVCLKTLQILLVVCGKGRTHDFKVLKRCKLKILAEIKKYGDSGYQGLHKLYVNSKTSHKKSKGGELTMVAMVTGNEEGFYRYQAPKPYRPGSESPKLSVVKYFEPFGWYIGTGAYLDDMRRNIQKWILDRMYNMQHEPGRYMYTFQYDGTVLCHTQKHYIGRNMLSQTDVNGLEVNRELLDISRNPGGGYVLYIWEKPETGQPAPKIAYASTYEDWEWVIVTDRYTDDVEGIL